ncbi:MAG TPA: hypothetical protein VME68_06660 [Acidobacteriaceae bacterium]|nr:hypothetical protein [Acidobacteriaceae bacterium]
MRSIVLMDGVLRGMGREAHCEMIVFKDTDPDTRQPTYSRWSVLDAPRDLPDGLYTVWCDDQQVPVRCEGGLWIAVEPPLAA